MQYKISYAKSFRKMLKRLLKSGKFSETVLEEVIDALSEGLPLPAARRDHSLHGDLQLFRECHLAGDFLLVYERMETIKEITLHKIGTHHELFGS